MVGGGACGVGLVWGWRGAVWRGACGMWRVVVCGVVWWVVEACGVVWCGVVWCGVAWWGAVGRVGLARDTVLGRGVWRDRVVARGNAPGMWGSKSPTSGSTG